ncbi:hypothetical protein JB92DRAFT_2992552 [Gautieria morchelliformis]|nr:hypothetical protein JB92DRAFT_2992552 [Gautieria morchelliformis]
MEMEDLSKMARVAKPNKTLADNNSDPSNSTVEDPRDMTTDSTITLWTYATATWFVMMSIPFLAFPRFLLFLSSTGEGGDHREYKLTPLERFLSTHFAILALSVAVGIIISLPSDSPITVPSSSQTRSYGHPLLVPITLGLLISAFLSYNTSISQVGPLAFLMALGAGTAGLWGVFALLFGGSSSTSRKTGADKHTSRFLFWNRSASSAQKRQWKKGQKAYER